MKIAVNPEMAAKFVNPLCGKTWGMTPLFDGKGFLLGNILAAEIGNGAIYDIENSAIVMDCRDEAEGNEIISAAMKSVDAREHVAYAERQELNRRTEAFIMRSGGYAKALRAFG